MPKAVECYDLTGKFIKKYPSIKKASEVIGVNTRSLWKALTTKNSTCRGMRWKYCEQEVTDKDGNMPNMMILQLEGSNVVNRFKTIKDASKANGLKESEIYRCLVGELQELDGYTFEFENDYSQYKNPHTPEERREYRERALVIAEHIRTNGRVVDEKVKEWHKWERAYSRKK